MKNLKLTLTEDEVRTIETALKYLHGLALEDISDLDDAMEPGDLVTAKRILDHKQAVRHTEALYKALKKGVLRGGG